jgi:hypothetical protein
LDCRGSAGSCGLGFVQVERVEILVVLVLVLVLVVSAGIDGVVEAGEGQGVGSAFPFVGVGPLAVFGLTRCALGGGIVGAANRIADERFCAVTVSRMSADVAQSLWAIIADAGESDDDGEPSFFAELKADPGKLGLETLLSEVIRLGRVRAVGLPADLFTDVAEKRIARWRARCAAV